MYHVPSRISLNLCAQCQLYMLLPMQMEFGSGRGKSKTNLQYNIRNTSTNCFSDDFAYHVQHKNRNYTHGMAFVDFHHRNKNSVLSLWQFGFLESKQEYIFVQFRKRLKHFSTFGNKLSVCVQFWNKNQAKLEKSSLC